MGWFLQLSVNVREISGANAQPVITQPDTFPCKRRGNSRKSQGRHFKTQNSAGTDAAAVLKAVLLPTPHVPHDARLYPPWYYVTSVYINRRAPTNPNPRKCVVLWSWRLLYHSNSSPSTTRELYSGYYSNRSPPRCNSFSVYYPDVYLQLNMFRAFSRPSSGAQRLQ